MTDAIVDNLNASNPGESILLINRLDPKNWNYDGMRVCFGDIPVFNDAAPDDVVIRTDTDRIRNIDRGFVEIRLSARHGQRHECPKCGNAMNIVKWIVTSYYTSPMMGMRTMLKVSVPQLHCRFCDDGYHKLRCPAVVENHTYTKMLKLDVLAMLSEETVKATAEGCKIGDWIVRDILNETDADGLGTQDLTDVTTIFIDEISCKKGHNYLTMVADQEHRTICGVKGHDMESVRKVRDWIVEKGGDPDKIQYVCADMSQAYKSGSRECFPKSKLILDVYHLDNSVNQALDRTRKRINGEMVYRGEEPIKYVKYTLLHRKDNHLDIHKRRMEEIRLRSTELALAFDLKEEFFDLFDRTFTKKQARSAFFRWYNRCRGSKIPEMADVAGRMFKRLNDILRWFDHHISNAVSEGMNSIYKKIKSAAYGYKNPAHLVDMCLFRKGRLGISI